MIKMFSRILLTASLIFISASVFSAQSKKTKKISNGERLMTALNNSKTLPGNFGDDGVFLPERERMAKNRPMLCGFSSSAKKRFRC